MLSSNSVPVGPRVTTTFIFILTATVKVMMAMALVQGVGASEDDTYEESLKIRSLPSNHIEAHFEFLTKTRKLSNFTRLFPRALSEILTTHHVQELHITLTQGHWRLESWGDPQLAAPSGALVTAWFKARDKEDADANWKGLTSRLSGLSCASLNFLDEKTSFEPYYSYRPQGKIQNIEDDLFFVRVGALPKEHICTENLTPWTKLLPCGLTRGLASHLRSKQVFNTHYHSMGIHMIPTNVGIELKLSLSLVYDRPVDLRLKPSDNLVKKVIGSLGFFPCYPASKTTVEIWKNGQWVGIDYNEINALKLSDIPEGKPSDLQLIFTPVKYMGGYGQEYGEIIVEMTNHLSNVSLPVLYIDVLPWYIRPYLYTMKLETKPNDANLAPIVPGELFHYTPGRDREVLHKLEMDLTLPPKSTVILSFLVEKGHLKWDEYPPDANHGFYLQAAHFEVTYPNSDSDKSPRTLFYYSRKLLVNLSTPDFSMPYNVICLTCTVVALAFGPIHNITTKRLGLKSIESKKEQLKKFINKILRRKPTPVETPVEVQPENEENPETTAEAKTTTEVETESADEPKPKMSSRKKNSA